ncbi:MAG: class IV adenylate cyclase [Clostridiaceae bacterium]|jgi:adenylate cyclase class 2|nr:class IV adenylate cyclase [Clostridiaceae bacterium]
MLEIELKASLEPQTVSRLKEKLDAEFSLLRTLAECDIYYNAPDRDFRQTDEALRIRRQETDQVVTLLTYKGPKTDDLSNTRIELETELADADKIHGILEALGYTLILTVDKQRLEYTGQTDLGPVTICLDQVEGLGAFIELEHLAPDDLSDEERESVRNRLLSLLDDLEVSRENLTRKSYLQLLIQRQAP